VKEHFIIAKTPVVRDERLERRIIEYNRERMAYIMLIAGSALLLLAILY
jgi:hypothetical protein